MKEKINHPSHYNLHKSGVECIDVIERMNFCIGSAIKYIWRAKDKESYLDDLKKARWYIERYKQRFYPLKRIAGFILFPETRVDFLVLKFMAYEEDAITASLINILYDLDMHRKSIKRYKKRLLSALDHKIEKEEIKIRWEEHQKALEAKRVAGAIG